MREQNRRSDLIRKTADILKGRDGASLVLVTIIAILVITAVVILRVTTSSLWASADKQYNQDQAYMMASSMGESIDTLIQNGTDPMTFDGKNDNGGVAIPIPGSSIEVSVVQSDDQTYYTVSVVSHVGNAEYQYNAVYQQANGNYVRVS